MFSMVSGAIWGNRLCTALESTPGSVVAVLGIRVHLAATRVIIGNAVFSIVTADGANSSNPALIFNNR